MKREKSLEEMVISMSIGNLIMTLIFAFAHGIFTSALEVAVFMVATWFIATFGAWTVIEVIDEEIERRKEW